MQRCEKLRLLRTKVRRERGHRGAAAAGRRRVTDEGFPREHAPREGRRRVAARGEGRLPPVAREGPRKRAR